MRLTGISESGTLAFHLKKLRGLIIKEEGLYKLTTRGKLIASILKGEKFFPVKESEMDDFIENVLSRRFMIPVGRYFLSILALILFIMYIVYVSINLILHVIFNENVLFNITSLFVFSEVMGVFVGAVLATDISYRIFSAQVTKIKAKEWIIEIGILAVSAVLGLIGLWIEPLARFLRGLFISTVLLIPILLLLYQRGSR